MLQSLSLLALLLSFQAVFGLPTDDCPILGPTYLASPDFAKSDVFKNATSDFPEQIKSLFSAGLVNETHSTFFLDVFSTETNSSLFSYSHAGSGLKGLTVPEPNDETIFRIGSVSKLFTAYAVLAAGGMEILNHPVTRYIPELAGNAQNESLGVIIWEDINVGALLAHEGGVGGVPIEATLCFVLQTGSCTVQDFYNLMRTQKRPATQPWATPMYSDAGYAILGRVLERVTGLPYNDAMGKVIFEPLGLNGSSAILPPSEGLNAMALEGDYSTSSWGIDNPLSEGSGGLYSNAADMRALGLSILHSEILSPAATREWMKPHGHTASLTISVGAPWEISRLGLPVSPGSERTRISDLYTKLGGQSGYGTVIALSPDHGIGFSVLVAGPYTTSERLILRNLLGELFIPAAELAAVEYADKNFTGFFADPKSENTNLTLTVDADKPGIGLESWYVEGVEWRANLTAIASEIPPANISVRIYPNGFSSGDEVGYYGVPTITPVTPRSDLEGGVGLFDDGCEAWQNEAFWYYGGTYPEEFVFTVEDGRLMSVFNPAAGVTMERVE